MCRKTHSSNEHDQLMKFNRYLVFYGPGEDGNGLKGIRSDAPEEVIDEFISWYRDRNRYENGRLKPEAIVRRNMLIDVSVCRGSED